MRKLLLLLFSLFIIGNTANSQVSHWKFEDNANDETGTNNGTFMYGDPALYVTGVSGKAIDFGAGNDSTHVAVVDDPSIDFDSTDSWTLSAFIDIPDISYGSDLAIFWKGLTYSNSHPDTNGIWYSFVFKGNQARIAIDDNVHKSQLGYSNAHLKMDCGWNHVVGVRDRAVDSLFYYINGENVASMKDVTDTNIRTTNLPLTIGNNQAQDFNFKGKIDEAQIYDIALTPAAINTLYRTYLPVPADLVGYWKLNVNALDETGTNNGTLMYGDESLYVEGVSGGALDFGAGNDSTHVAVADDPSIDFDSLQSFSLSAFVNIPDISYGNDLAVFWKGLTYSNSSPDTNGCWFSLVFKGNQARIAIDDNVNKSQLGYSNAHLKMNMKGWNHIVGVRDRAVDSLFYYINGEKVASMKDATDTSILTTNLPLTIGNNQAQDFNFKGQIDEAKIHNIALTPSEINDMYREYLPLPDDLAAYWKLDVNALDETGVNDGILTNGDASLYVEGVSGAAVDFGAGNDSTHIAVPDDPSIDFDTTQSFTLSALVNIQDINSSSDLSVFWKGLTYSNSHPDTNGCWYAMVFKQNQLRIAIDDNVNKSQLGYSNAHLKMDKYGWNHIVGVRDRADDSLYLYLNGEKVASMKDATDTSILTTNLPMTIGNNQAQDFNFKGQIDEPRIYNKALSPDEIEDLFDSYDLDIRLAPAGVSAWWKLNGDATDFLGASDGTLINGDDSLYVAGNTGQAVDFGKGTDSTYIEVPDNEIVDLDSTSFTISLLLKPDSVTATMYMFQKGWTGVDSALNRFGRWVDLRLTGGSMRFFIDDNINKTNLDYGLAHYKLKKNEWNLISAVRDCEQDSLFLYINALKVGSLLDLTETSIASTPLPLTIGNSQGRTDGCAAAMDEVRLYDVAMSAAEIAELMAEYGITAIPISTDATLINLAVNLETVPGFDPATFSYDVELAADATMAIVTAQTASPLAITAITQPGVIPGTGTVVCTAEDGTQLTYTVNITKEVSGVIDVSENNIALYPIPVNNVLNISNAGELTEIVIYDVSGAIILNQTTNGESTLQINVSELNSGLYLIKLVSINNDVINKTFVKE